MTPLHLPLSDLEGQNQVHSAFEALMSCKGAELGHMLLLNINTKPYMGSPLMQLHLTLVTFKGLCRRDSDFISLYLIT